MALKSNSHSRYKLSKPIKTVDGNDTFGLMTKFDFLDIDNLNDNQVFNYQVTSVTRHRPDLIATEVYGSPLLHWVVTMFNKPKSPWLWPEVNDVIKLPSKSAVLPYL